MATNANRANRSPIVKAALRTTLYPWHRRQRWGWQVAAQVDVDCLLDYVLGSRARRPQRREYDGSIWTPKGGRYEVTHGQR